MKPKHNFQHNVKQTFSQINTVEELYSTSNIFGSGGARAHNNQQSMSLKMEVNDWEGFKVSLSHVNKGPYCALQL